MPTMCLFLPGPPAKRGFRNVDSAEMVKVVSKFKSPDQQLDQGSIRSITGHSAMPLREFDIKVP